MKKILASTSPSPKTVWVRRSQGRHFVQPRTSFSSIAIRRRRFSSVTSGGTVNPSEFRIGMSFSERSAAARSPPNNARGGLAWAGDLTGSFGWGGSDRSSAGTATISPPPPSRAGTASRPSALSLRRYSRNRAFAASSMSPSEQRKDFGFPDDSHLDESVQLLK